MRYTTLGTNDMNKHLTASLPKRQQEQEQDQQH